MGNDGSSSGFSTKAGTGTASAGMGPGHYRLASLKDRVPGRRRGRKPAAPPAAPAPVITQGVPEAAPPAETPVDGPVIHAVTAIGLPEKISTALVELGYPTTNELVSTSPAELLSERGIGPARLGRIEDALVELGLALRADS